MPKKISKREQAFALFSEGKGPSSLEVKALGLTEGSRLTYHYDWNKAGKPEGKLEETINSEASPAIKSKTSLPGGEAIASITEAKNLIQKYQETVQQKQEQEPPEKLEEEFEDELMGEGEKPKKIEGKTEGIEAPSGGSKKKIPTTILGEGLKVTVFLSIGTLALYQIASSVQAQHDGEGELELGEFLDTCAADYFRVRGKTLGLITAGGK